MEQFVKFVCNFRRTRRSYDGVPTSPPSASSPSAAAAPSSSTIHNAPGGISPSPRSHGTQDVNGRRESVLLFWDALTFILLWEEVSVSFLVFSAINLIFWSIVIVDFNFIVAYTAVIVGMFWCSAILGPVQLERNVAREWYSRVGRFKQIGRKILHSLWWLRDEQPGLVIVFCHFPYDDIIQFCILACCISISVWLLGQIMDGVLFAYIILMCILLGPALLIKVSDRLSSRGSQGKESDSEIEEFLPAATETDIQVLEKAGETGECSATPTSTIVDTPNSATNEEQEFLNDGDLMGRKMPSHEDGSSDGLELSDLEISEKSSSTSSSSGQSDSEFEIIDHQEVRNLNTS